MNSCTFGRRSPFVPLSAPLSVFQTCLEQAQHSAVEKNKAGGQPLLNPEGSSRTKLDPKAGGDGRGVEPGSPALRLILYHLSHQGSPNSQIRISLKLLTDSFFLWGWNDEVFSVLITP